ncbi:MAG: hypothetical protein AAFN77_16740 [Planctomycetota bacterium]
MTMISQTSQLSDAAEERRVVELEQRQCVFCLRLMKHGTTRHHLIPRHCHRKRWFQQRFTREQMRATVPACRDCHKAIHKIVPREKVLGRDYNTVAKLMSHPEFAKFVDWVCKQR